MTYYCKVTPYALASSLPDYSNNTLQAPEEDTFTASKIFEVSTTAIGYDYETSSNWTTFSLPGWTDNAATLIIQNTGTVKLWVYFIPAEEGANYATNTEFITVGAGRTAVVQFDSQYYGPLFGNVAFDQEQVLYVESGSATVTATFTLKALGE